MWLFAPEEDWFVVALESADELVGLLQEPAAVHLAVPAFEPSEPENGVETD